MKRSRADVYRAMRVGRFGEPDFAELPLCFGRRGDGTLKPQISVGKRDDDVVIPVNVPERGVTGRHGHIPDADKLIFELRMMMRLAFDFDRRLWRVVRLRPRAIWNQRESQQQ